jgi:hypothetical protein
MPDRHKRHPIPFRPPEGDRAWLEAYAGRTGEPVNRILTQLVARLRYEIDLIDAHEQHEVTPALVAVRGGGRPVCAICREPGQNDTHG